MDLVKFREDLYVDYKDVKEALIGIVENYSGLTIKGPTDAEGYAKAREVMKEAGKIRRNIDEKRKAHKADSLAIGKMIDEVAKELQVAINPLEDRLKAEVQAIDDHIEKQNALKKAEADWPGRKEKLLEFGYDFVSPDKAGEAAEEEEHLILMTDAEFLQLCNGLQQEKLAAIEAENKRLRDEAVERDRVAKENQRIEEAKEQARKDALQETVNRDAATELQKSKEMEEKVWPLREKRVREIFVAKEVTNPEPRLEKLKALIVKMDEPAFETYLVELAEHADATLKQRQAEMGDREKMADFYKRLLAVQTPELSAGSIYQSDLAEFLDLLREGAKMWGTEVVGV